MTNCRNKSVFAKTWRALLALLLGLGMLASAATGVSAPPRNTRAPRQPIPPRGSRQPIPPRGPRQPIPPRGPRTSHLGGGQGVLSKQNQVKIQKAINRLDRRLRNAQLRSALQNVALGRPISAAQIGSLGAYLNDPGCGLTADEQGCIQQYLGLAAVATPPEDGGVLLLTVERRAAADRAGLRAGDIILSFGGVPTRTFEELRDAVRQADGPVQVVFVNGENGQTEYCVLEPQEGRIGVTCE